MNEEQRHKAITHWDELIAQWIREKKMPRNNERKPITNDPGRGVLFHRSQGNNEKAPTLKGGMCCPGCKTEFEVSGWERDSRAGQPYISLQIQKPYAQREKEVNRAFPKQHQPEPWANDDSDGDVKY
jgi:hypothetical protein